MKPPAFAMTATETTTSKRTSSGGGHAYLPHLDGIRAIALTGVILFHFEVSPFMGGYLGVDVFLVLSGYLITRNLLHSLDARKLSLPTFYRRRFRRLYPASAATTLLVVLASFLLYAPQLALDAARSAVASLTLCANVFFHAQAGYFDADANTKPLLHMWSLSLEEQFYLLWAPAVAVMHAAVPASKSRVLPMFLLCLAAVSFALAVMLTPTFPTFVFFQLPTRVFQFAAGACLAAYQRTAAAKGAAVAGSNTSNDGSDSNKENDVYSIVTVPTLLSNTTVTTTPMSSAASSPPRLSSTMSCSPTRPPPQAPASSSSSPQASAVLIHPRDEMLMPIRSPSMQSSPLPLMERASDRSSSNTTMGGTLNENVPSIMALLLLMVSYIATPAAASVLYALPPTICTVLLIATPQTCVLHRLLSHALPRALGHLSYSAYLVHWPLYVFARHVSLAEAGANGGGGTLSPVALVVTTILGALALKRLVEDPFRHHQPPLQNPSNRLAAATTPGNQSSRARPSAASVGTCRVLMLVILVVAAAAAAMAGVMSDGFAFRGRPVSDTDRIVTSALKAGLSPTRTHACLNATPILHARTGGAVTSHICHAGDPTAIAAAAAAVGGVGADGGIMGGDEEGQFTFFGNSFSAMYVPTLTVIGRRRRQFYRVYTGHSCMFRARSHVHEVRVRGELQCNEYVLREWDAIERMRKGSVVVLSSMWGFPSIHAMRHVLLPIYHDILHLGLRLALIGEPPGMGPSYFACVDLARLPFGRLLLSVGATAPCAGGGAGGSGESGLAWNRTNDIGNVALEKGEKGVPPNARRLVQQVWYERVFANHLTNATFVSLYRAVCRHVDGGAAPLPGRRDGGGDGGGLPDFRDKGVVFVRDMARNTRCWLPVGTELKAAVDDPGYMRDGDHLSLYGAYNLVAFFEQKLFEPLTSLLDASSPSSGAAVGAGGGSVGGIRGANDGVGRM